MPRQKSRGQGGGGRGRGGGRGSSRGGGGGSARSFGRGGGGRGRHGFGGAIQKAKNPNDPFKKFKHIQRNQEAEDMLRQRKQLEVNQQRNAQRKEEVQTSSSEEEEDPMDQLLGLLQTSKKGSKKLTAIESSDSEMDDDSESNGEEADGIEDMEDDEEDIQEEDESEGDDEDDFNINEQFEEQTKIKMPIALNKKSTSEDSPNSNVLEELDSSDEDEDDILRPEEDKRTSKSDLKSSIEKDYVIYDSQDDESEAESDQELESVDEINQTADAIDMFSLHLDNDLSPSLLECVNTTHTSISHDLIWPKLGRLHVEIPSASLDKQKKTVKRSKATLLDSNEKHAPEGTAPIRLDHKSATFTDYGIKSQIQPHVQTANSINLSSNPQNSSLLTGLQAELFSIMQNYQDIYYPARTHENGEEIRFAYCMHALNHILKTRSKILHHNAKLAKIAAEQGNAPSILPDSFRDQGLFRPKVLIVVPFRESALRVVNILTSLIFPEMGAKVAHYARFQEEFGGEGLYFPKRNPKPEDYEKTFAGNSDDTFRVGISLTRKSMKLYSDFYSSDILIVSPLGLRMIVGAPGEKDRDYDFLASIELMILDQADLFLAQNWDHLLHVLDHLHLQPQSARNTDFSRVRSWCLNGWARFYRQTLLFTTHELPEFRSLFNSRCANYRGRVRIANPVESGSIRHVTVQVPQVIYANKFGSSPKFAYSKLYFQLFHRVDVTSIQTSFDQRFNHFTNTVLPQFKGASMAHCLILVPSYFDFVRLRNYFKKESINFVQICEYTKVFINFIYMV